MNDNTIEVIDFVLPWVDGNDPEWQKQRAKYSDQTLMKNKSASRYRDMNTLKYVLRSIEKNCPWYNKIHIITCGHKPEWINAKHPKINFITHKEMYFETSHLPVFNSSSIEMNLPNLQNVSEQFIYLNDDTLIIKSVDRERFFKDGKPIDFLSHGWIPRNKLFKYFRGMDPWVYSLVNNLKLVNDKLKPLNLNKSHLYHHSYSMKNKASNFFLQKLYKKIIWMEHWHHPQPYLMTSLKEVHKEFPKEMSTSSKNKFRANNDLTQYLYRYWQLANNAYAPYKHNDGVAISLNSQKQLRNNIKLITKNNNISFACFNDSDNINNEEFIKIKTILSEYLNQKFPEPATFEV